MNIKILWKYRISAVPEICHLRQVTKIGVQLYVLTIESQILIYSHNLPLTIHNMPPTSQTQSYDKDVSIVRKSKKNCL